eukprot:TRINITY_DN6937_c0_g1_i2.p1 TRINITY_DN6937_c0_g1~~TRINITY_DN6937_c0_g1_i2.p1  ORF type:complete len:378 (+),score=126.74 TRINITY_DN6937_c0_g1_i2:80-1213(+)
MTASGAGPKAKAKAAAAPSAAAADGKVLVAWFPDEEPEIHFASLDLSTRTLTLCQVVQGASGNYETGPPRHVKLASAKAIEEADDNTLQILGANGQASVSLQFQSAAEEREFLALLKPLLSSGASAAPAAAPARGGAARAAKNDGDEEDTAALRARSTHLQNRITELEAVSDRRDEQIRKMQKRLESATKMLVAIQDLCEQQRKVLEAQRGAAEEIRRETGVSASAPAAARTQAATASATAAAATSRAAQASAPEEFEDEEDEEMDFDPAMFPGQMAQMAELLAQAEEMQGALAQLKKMSANAEGVGATAQALGAQSTGLQAAVSQQVQTNEAMIGLHEHLKAQTQAELRQQENERDMLQSELVKLQSLMAALGVEP